MKIKIADMNGQLIFKLKQLGYDAVRKDYLEAANETPDAVLMTASNPSWTFGGGLDYYVFTLHFPEQVAEKQARGGPMERIGNICFCITVDESLRATPEQVEAALRFAKESTGDDETLVLSGIGTGIGGMSIEDFIDVFQKVFPRSE